MPAIPAPSGSSSPGVFAHAGLYSDAVFYPSGTLAPSVPITINLPGTSTAATIFTDRTKATAAVNPVVSDSLGNLVFYASPGDYDIWVEGVLVTTIQVPIDPADTSAAGTANPASTGVDLTGSPAQVTSTHLASPLPVAQGGTGSAIQNWVDLTTGQTVAGIKAFTSSPTVPAPVLPTDVANKAYADLNTSVQAPKLPAKLGTIAVLSPANTYSSGVLTATGNGTLTVDGVAVVLNDRILVQNEAAPANNGVYSCTTAGTGGVPYVLTRTTDMNTGGSVPGATCLVTAGGTLAGNGYTVAGAGPFTLGTTAINWIKTSQGNTYTAGTNISIASGVVSVTGVGSASGIASLDSGSRVPTTALPLSVSQTIQLSERSFSDGVITSTTTLTSATAAFTNADTGRTVVGANIPVGTTLTYSSATVCTLSQASTNGTVLVCTVVQGVYPLRSTVTADATRNIVWRGALAPTAGGGYMTAGTDDYLSTA